MDKSQKMQVRVLIIFLICLGIFTIISGIKAFSHDQEEYTFDLEDIGNVSLKDFHALHPNLTRLDISASEQDDISDIRLFTKLTELDISLNPYMLDISPLTALTDLRSLKAIWNKHIKDWSILTTLKNLEEITLTQYPDLDTSFAQHLPKLTKLELLHVTQGNKDHPIQPYP